MNIRLLAAGLLLVSAAAIAAPADNTASQYKPTSGAAGSVNGVVIQQSEDGYNSLPVNAEHPLPTTATVSAPTGGLPTIGTAATETNSSSTVTIGGTFQQAAAASPSRKSLEFQNICNIASECTATTNNCRVSTSGTPSSHNSRVIKPGELYLRASGSIPSNAIQVTCDGTGDHFYLSVQ